MVFFRRLQITLNLKLDNSRGPFREILLRLIFKHKASCFLRNKSLSSILIAVGKYIVNLTPIIKIQTSEREREREKEGGGEYSVDIDVTNLLTTL